VGAVAATGSGEEAARGDVTFAVGSGEGTPPPVAVADRL
jgi:hypothetical protein